MTLPKYLGILSTAFLIAGCDKNSANEPDRGTANTGREMTNAVARSDSADAKNADNTGKNVRDRSDATLTPGDQGNSDQDIQTTVRIRRALMSNGQLSTLAKNIKIITVDGKVTLRGPVNTDQEKQTIEAAVKQAGAATVDNQLEVKTNNP
jgi:hyperosmotically inducible protein